MQHAKGRTGDCPGPRKETTTRRNVTQGVEQGRISVSQTLCEIFVHNLFGVFKDLHRYVLDCAFAHVYHAKGFGQL